VIALVEAGGWQPAWPAVQVRALWLTLLWAAGGLVMLTLGARRGPRPLWIAGWCILLAAGGVWLTHDTLFWRVYVGAAAAVWPVWNLQFAVGALLLGLLVAARHVRSPDTADTAVTQRESGFGRSGAAGFMGVAGALIVALGLWLGSLEIDRYCTPAGRFWDSAMAVQTGLSIWWGLYGIGLVAVGFARQSAPLRWVGLALLAVTLGKVLIVDMARVRYLYRVLSLLGVGLVCMACSIAYAKLASRLRRPPETARP